MQYQKYDAYKDSGVLWLGDIPEHWELYANKYLMDLSKTTVGKNAHQYKLLSLTLNGIIARDMENPKGKFPTEFDTYQEVKKDELVFCLFDIEETPRTVGHSSMEGMITGAYTVFKCKPKLHSKYMYYYYLSLDEKKRLKPLYSGLRNVIQKDTFMSMKSPLPPFEEQQAIAEFIDKKTSEIDAHIDKQERLIALLKERRTAIINKAVTRGLDENVKLKDSGIDWLGEIPEHWEMKKLRALLKPVSYKNRPELPLLSVVREKGIIVRDIEDQDSNHNFIPDDLSNYKVVSQGQFVMNKMKAWQGSYGASDFDGIVSPAYFTFDLKGVQPKFFHEAIRSKMYVPFFTRASDGVRIGQWDLSKSRMKEIPFWIPSELEQQQIVEHIAEQTKKTINAISIIEQEIQTLKEYRQSFISNAVTGKIRVI
jgi:type I restriction enzyme S subunit